MKKKDLISLLSLLTFGVLFFLDLTLSYSQTFKDVDPVSANIQAIDYLKANGIINGYPDGTFKPDQSINRAEALKIILLAKDHLKQPSDEKNIQISFLDVKPKDWFHDFVISAAKSGIVEGYKDGNFKPSQDVLAAEGVKMAILALSENKKYQAPDKNPYTDVEKNAWFAPYIFEAKKLNLIEASDNYNYYPARNFTRSEFAELIFRIIHIKNNNIDVFPLSLTWRYCNNHELGYKIKTPFSWLRMGIGNHFVIWKKDQLNSQISFARIFPNSATVIVAIDENPYKLNLSQYIKLIDYGPESNVSTQTLNGYPYAAVNLENSGLTDSYFLLPNGSVLAIYTQVGNGPLSEQLKEEVRYIIGSARHSDGPATDEDNCIAKNSHILGNTFSKEVGDIEKIISELNSSVLQEGMAKKSLEKLGNTIILETDSIGIGTGPIDYHYSLLYDHTVKVDRNSNTILAVKKGKITSF